MSMWTHITAAIYIDSYMYCDNLKEEIEKKIKDAPAITGSEEDACIFVNIMPGYNASVSHDCNRCKYFKEEINEGYYYCEKPDDSDYKCKPGKYQSCAMLTIAGNLRNRDKEKTLKEFNEVLNFLEKNCKFSIRNYSININQD